MHPYGTTNLLVEFPTIRQVTLLATSEQSGQAVGGMQVKLVAANGQLTPERDWTGLEPYYMEPGRLAPLEFYTRRWVGTGKKTRLGLQDCLVEARVSPGYAWSRNRRRRGPTHTGGPLVPSWYPLGVGRRWVAFAVVRFKTAWCSAGSYELVLRADGFFDKHERVTIDAPEPNSKPQGVNVDVAMRQKTLKTLGKEEMEVCLPTALSHDYTRCGGTKLRAAASVVLRGSHVAVISRQPPLGFSHLACPPHCRWTRCRSACCPYGRRPRARASWTCAGSSRSQRA
jgi:hypothetical protein